MVRVRRRLMYPELGDTVIIGIDPSSIHLAMVVFTPRGHFHHEWTLGKKAGADACAAAYAACEWAANEYSEDLAQRHAFIEHPLVGRGGIRTTMVQSFASGAMQAALHQASYSVTLVHQATWKAQVIGSGRADKDEVARSVRHRWPSLYEACAGSQDLIDATAIGILGGRRAVGPRFMVEESPMQRLGAAVLRSRM